MNAVPFLTGGHIYLFHFMSVVAEGLLLATVERHLGRPWPSQTQIPACPCLPFAELNAAQCCPVLAPGDLQLIWSRKPALSFGICKPWEAGAEISPGWAVPVGAGRQSIPNLLPGSSGIMKVT